MKLPPHNAEQVNALIRMAWHDRTSFDQIEEKTGWTEKQVIKLMRREMKPSSFRMWRKRVSGRVTKHRRLFKAQTGDSE